MELIKLSSSYLLENGMIFDSDACIREKNGDGTSINRHFSAQRKG